MSSNSVEYRSTTAPVAHHPRRLAHDLCLQASPADRPRILRPVHPSAAALPAADTTSPPPPPASPAPSRRPVARAPPNAAAPSPSTSQSLLVNYRTSSCPQSATYCSPHLHPGPRPLSSALAEPLPCWHSLVSPLADTPTSPSRLTLATSPESPQSFPHRLKQLRFSCP